MTDIHPVRSVFIEGQPARAVISAKAIQPGDELRSVKEAEDIDREKASPADSNHCPLCLQYFGPEAFRAHAQDCINTRAPKWERQRDTDPQFKSKNGGVKRFRPPIFGPKKGA